MKSLQQTERKVGIIGFCFWVSIKCIVWALLGWLLAYVIAMAITVFYPSFDVYAYFHLLTDSQLQYIAFIKTTGGLNEPQQWVVHYLQLLNNMEWFKTWVSSEILPDLPENNLTTYPVLNYYLKVGSAYLLAALKLLRLSTELTVTRLCVLILFMPTFLLAFVLGLIEGLLQRDLRRFGGGRESALVYHRARSCIAPLFLWACLLYLMLPIPVTPVNFLLPFTLLIAFAAAITARTFKKYL